MIKEDNLGDILINKGTAWSGIIDTYRDYLPVSASTPIVSLNEGNTPLISARNLCKKIGFEGRVYFKFDGLNPTGSFKDRGMTMAISKAVEEGGRAVICASTGNTSASAAAYAARAGISCIVLIPEGKIALGKLAQALIHGAVVLQIKGNFDVALSIVRAVVAKYPITLVNSINPYRIEGQKTAAFEVCDQLGAAPDYHVLPVGNAGNITAYWKGYRQYKDNAKINTLPVMVGIQAAGAAPIVRGCVVENPETVASAIRIGNPASWKFAVEARDDSGGTIDMVTDEEILDAYALVAKIEGIFCEPASAASIAGLIKLNAKGYFKKNSTIVCTLTGNGLKDPDTVFKVTKDPLKVWSDINAVEDYIRQLI
ncbi:MAG: threonine synthase [Nitrospirae bacterium]|nr:threonine synthase [Nitrospirota bacterium]MBF0591308.1 threonine synthase [Nitrospirota bacterium]